MRPPIVPTPLCETHAIPWSYRALDTSSCISLLPRTRSRWAFTCAASGVPPPSESETSKDHTTKKNPSSSSRLPKKGYFADVDTKSEVYPVRSGLNSDLTKRGGRWESDFVWNSDVKRALEFQDAARRELEDRKNAAGSADGGSRDKGFLSLRSKIDLNSMDVDLSSQLKPRGEKEQRTSARPSDRDARRSLSAQRAALARQQQSQLQQRGGSYASNPPTRGESRSWDRSNRFAQRAAILPADDSEMDEEALAKREAERARYEQLKAELQTWAAVMTAVGLAATYAFYGRDVAASYGVGAVGGLMYLRLLHKSVDGVASGSLGAALGQPRLLIPVILALGYNRYNELVAVKSGLSLQLLPMLVGFFTYKLAAIGRESIALFEELSSGFDNNKGDDGSPDREADSQRDSTEVISDMGSAESRSSLDARSVDRAFRKRIING